MADPETEAAAEFDLGPCCVCGDRGNVHNITADRSVLKTCCRGYPAEGSRVPIGTLPPGEFDHDPSRHPEWLGELAPDDAFDIDDENPGAECGRWSNGRLTRHCALAGTEFCDFECPYG
jgi:hypothetical protein